MDAYFVLGNPIAHSRSPFIHQAFAAQCGQALTYGAQCVGLEDFSAHIQSLRAQGVRGANVTVPFKNEAFALATRRTPRGQAAGALNTLMFEDGGDIVGDNTDGAGLLQDLRHNLGFEIQDKRILVLGAGGAAQGVLLPLLSAGPRALVVANRTAQKAQDLLTQFAAHAPPGVLYACGLEAIRGPFDGLINATAASLKGVALSLPATTYAPHAWVYDMMYGATPTAFLAQAQAQGVTRWADGLGMLVEQAAESFALWRGVRPQTAPVLAALRKMLQTA